MTLEHNSVLKNLIVSQFRVLDDRRFLREMDQTVPNGRSCRYRDSYLNSVVY